MSLKELFDTMDPQEREIQFGRDTCDPLTRAFQSKRVVHAGLGGQPVTGEEAVSVWNRIMEEDAPKKGLQSAYIHIPFCQTKCLYCGFFQHASAQEIEDQYVKELVKEIESASTQHRFRDGLIQAVFIGGGTPTSLSAENAERLLSTIQRCFPLSNDYELTLEGRIHDCVPEKMDVWMANGVNRVSLGVQSFHTKVRQQVGRIDDQETVLKRLEDLASYKQASIIVDLIYGLPDQTMDVWLEDLALMEASAADGMDIYQLNVYENSDLQKYITNGKLSRAATTEEQAQMYQEALNYLRQRDFSRLSACHWSRSIRERSMYNTMAKRGYPMFPFGCGAGGNVGGYAMMMHRALAPYNKYREMGIKPIMALMKQSPLQPVADLIIDQLERCRFDLRPLVAIHPELGELGWLYQLWEKRGLVKFNGLMWELTDAGDFWHVNLTQSTLECAQYLVTGETSLFRESIAAQDGRPAGHPGKSSGEGEAPSAGGHPAGVPKTGGHPAGIPKTGGHPAGIPKTGGHPAGIPKTGGHPAGIPKTGGHPSWIPKVGKRPEGVGGDSADGGKTSLLGKMFGKKDKASSGESEAPSTGGHPSWIPKVGKRPEHTMSNKGGHPVMMSAMGLKVEQKKKD